MHPNARELVRVMCEASGDGVLEKDLREPVERYLMELAKTLGIEMVAHTERTLGSSGRADTIYNRFIIEWEKPGSLKLSNAATKNRETVAQAQKYGDSLFWVTREKPGRIVACCTDGRYLIFLTKPARKWDPTDPVPVDEASCSKFLDYFCSLQSDRALLPDYLSEDFSSAHVRTQRAVKALYTALLDHKQAPGLEAIFEQWAQFFGAVTEYEQWRVKLANEDQLRAMLKTFHIPQDGLDLNRFFFATHTFFAILTKLLAYVIVGRYTDLPMLDLKGWKDLPNADLAAQFTDLEKGGPFRNAGIQNFLEGDFFSWYVRFFTPEIADHLREVVMCLANYDPATLDLAPAPTQDLLKKLYHRLVSPHIRKALGEYYTPDWLAQRVLHMLDGGRFRGAPDTRLLDPACGSGTFLIMTINAIRANAMAQSMDEGELLRAICHNVVGIDLNPLAVIAARTNYLLALGPLLKHRRREPLEIPVYLADSIMTPSRPEHDLLERETFRVWLSIGKVELPRRLATQEGVAKLTELLDKHLEKEQPTPTDKFLQQAKADLVAVGAQWEHDADLVGRLYETLAKLHRQGRNGMWARILKNAFAPVFLAPFDYVAGNPPWINWQNLPEGYRNETKNLWVQHGLFVHKGMDTILGKGKKDISTLMTYVAADSYLKDGGKLGFVITQSVFKTSGAGQGFRRFVTRRKVPLAVTWVDDFSEMQPFEGATNRTAVFVMRKGQPTKYPVQYGYWTKREGGRAGGFDYDATLEEVTAKCVQRRFVAEPVKLDDPTSAWLTGSPLALKAIKKLLGRSDYEAHAGVYTGGANAVYWFEVLTDHGDGTVTARNVTEGAKRKIDSVQVRLEKELLYPLLRGRDVSRWIARPSAHILFVQDVRRRRGIDAESLEDTWAYEWLTSHKTILMQRAAFRRYFDRRRDPFYSMFNVGEYTLSRWKVAWSEQSREFEAAVVGSAKGKIILPANKCMVIPCGSEPEAHYVAGVLNSTLFRFGVASYAIEIQLDPHLVANLRVPEFQPDAALHRRIAAEAERLSSGAADAAEPVHEKLDALCAQLWGIDDKSLRAVQSAYRDLYVRGAAAVGPARVRENGVEYETEEATGGETAEGEESL
jgi:methylase of polypeptide subunit release factors